MKTPTPASLLIADLFPPNAGFDVGHALRRAIQSVDEKFAPWWGRGAVVERVHTARDEIDRKKRKRGQRTIGYRLTPEAYRWVQANIEAGEAKP
jgi:hypothetical protein